MLYSQDLVLDVVGAGIDLCPYLPECDRRFVLRTHHPDIECGSRADSIFRTIIVYGRCLLCVSFEENIG